MDALAASDGCNPLECQDCHAEMVKPVRLPCQHYFCRGCVKGERCPLCKSAIETEVLEDPILGYVIESSHEPMEVCGNCDEICQPMFFCETCQEPLCGECRKITHQAKIFLNHGVSLLEERGRLRGRVICQIHSEPFIIFCLDLKKLMCVECFNASSLERDGNFVNIDLAHKICCDKLERSVLKMRMFQEQLVEQIEGRKLFAKELDANFNTVKMDLEKGCNRIVEQIFAIKNSLLAKISHEKTEKQQIVDSQLKAMKNLLQPIRVNLLSASIFCSYASKIDLLHYYSELSKAMQTVLGSKFDKLQLSNGITFDFKRELFKQFADEINLNLGQSTASELVPLHDAGENSMKTIGTNTTNLLLNTTKNVIPTPPKTTSLGDLTLRVDNAPVDYSIHYSMNSSCLVPDLQAAFSDIVQQLDSPIKTFISKISLFSRELVNVQRDITLRRCVVGKDEFLRILEGCETLKDDLDKHVAKAQHLHGVCRDIWQEQRTRIQRQQSQYLEKAEELCGLQKFAGKILDSALQLKPFAFYIASIISTFDHKRTQLINFSPMEQICLQISSLEPDSQQRIEAIEKEEESRRIAKLQQKTEFVTEAHAMMKCLKEIKMLQPKVRTQNSIVVENSRERTVITSSLKSNGKRKKKNSDRSNSMCSTSSQNVFSPTSSSLEIECCSSISSTPPFSPSPMQISPQIQSSQDAQPSKNNASLSAPKAAEIKLETRSTTSQFIAKVAPLQTTEHSITVTTIESVEAQSSTGKCGESSNNANDLSTTRANNAPAEKTEPSVGVNASVIPPPTVSLTKVLRKSDIACPSDNIMQARQRLLESIKEKVKRIEPYDEQN